MYYLALSFHLMTPLTSPSHPQRILIAADKYLGSGQCDAHCRWLIRNAVSVHIGARAMPSIEHAAGVMRRAARSHWRAMQRLDEEDAL